MEKEGKGEFCACIHCNKLSNESLSRLVKTLSAHKQADFLEILEISLQIMQNLDSAFIASSTFTFAVDFSSVVVFMIYYVLHAVTSR